MRPRLRQVGDVCRDSGYEPCIPCCTSAGGSRCEDGGHWSSSHQAGDCGCGVRVDSGCFARGIGDGAERRAARVRPASRCLRCPRWGCPQCPRRRPCRPFHRCRAFRTSPATSPRRRRSRRLRCRRCCGRRRAVGPSRPQAFPRLLSPRPTCRAGSRAVERRAARPVARRTPAQVRARPPVAAVARPAPRRRAPGRVPAVRELLAPGSGRTARCAGGRCAASATGSRRPRPMAASHCSPRAGGASYGFAQGSAPAARLPRA